MEEERPKPKEKEIKVNDFSLFAPKSVRILWEDYPELKMDHGDTFKSLSTTDILFVWYYACEASPLFNILNERKRADECIKVVYKGSKKVDEGFKEALRNLKFPDKMQKAIQVMSKFRIGPRLRAKIIAERIFDNLEKILDIDGSDDTNFTNKEGDVDWTKKKAYMDTSAKAIDIMPTLLAQLESSFSISDKKKPDTSDEGVDGQSFMDEFHEQRG